MTHGLETIKRLNDEACQGAEPTVADVRFVMKENHHEAVYIDGELFEKEGTGWIVGVGVLSDELQSRPATIKSHRLSDDANSQDWPPLFNDLISYIETESGY